MNNEYALLIDMVQKESCINCSVYEYTNRDCSKCPNNLEQELQDIYNEQNTDEEDDDE